MTAKVNASQVRILKYMAKLGRPVSREQLEEKSGATASAHNLGPVNKELLATNGYGDSLFGLGYVRPKQYEGEGVTWELTQKGQKAAAIYETAKRVDCSRVPSKILDPVVIEFMKTRTYGLERYTEGDLKEIRAKLGEDWADLPIGELQLQIVNRRKQNAFSSPEARKRRPAIMALSAFGPKGWVSKNLLTDEQVAKLEKIIRS